MSKLPEDLDRMIWEVAESGDRQAIDNFGTRFPHLQNELGKRLLVVEKLKNSRSNRVKPNAAVSRIPQYDAGKFRKDATRNSVMLLSAWSLALLAIGSCGFLVTKLAINNTSSVGTISVPAKERVNTDKDDHRWSRNGVGSVPQSVPPPNGSGIASVPNMGPTSIPTNRPAVTQNESTLISLRLKGVPLQTALLAVAQAGKLRLSFAPGMPNPIIELQYNHVPAISVLQDLGQQFKFTAEEQEQNNFLIIPAVDPTAPPSPGVNGSASEFNSQNH